jgi:signal transduction histidine kinase
MPAFLRSLLAPLNFAAYVAWAAIGSELWRFRLPSADWAQGQPVQALAVGLHLLFLALFLAHVLRPALARAATVLQLLAALAVLALVKSSTAPILLVIVAAQGVQLWPLPGVVAGFVATNAAAYLIYSQLWGGSSATVTTVLHASFQAFAGVTAWYAHRAEQARDELVAVNADLLATRSLLAESARDSERLRLSRELHDIAGHKLTALKLNLSALARDPRFAGTDAVPLCAQLADELLADIRGVVQQMRLHDGMDLRSAIGALAAPFPRPRVHLELAGEARVADVAQAEAVLRTVQEALTNAARHGNAENVWVVLRREAGEIALDIRDDGRGVGALRFGNGLRGMRERLEALGGQLQAERNSAGGVRLLARFPVAA